MAVAKVSAIITADISEFNNKMNAVQQKMRTTMQQSAAQATHASSSINNLTGSLSGLTGTLAGIAASAAVATAGLVSLGAVRGIRVNAEIEKAKISLTTLTGSAEKAAKMIDQLRQLGAESPFDFSSLQQSAKLLLAMGVNAKNVVPYVTAMGDAVAAVGGGSDELQRVALAFSQINAKGKVSAEEMNQLAENGIPAWQILSEKMGKSTQELMKMGSDGKLFAKDVLPLLVEGLRDKFGGAMKKTSATFDGMLEQMKEQADMTLGTLFEPLFDGLKKVMPKVIDLIKETNDKIKKEGFSGLLKGMLKDLSPDFLKDNIDNLFAIDGLIKRAIEEKDWEWLGRLIVEKVKNAIDAADDVTDAIIDWIDKIDWGKVTKDFIEGIGDFATGVAKQIDEKTGKALENGDTLQASYGLGVWLGKVVQNAIKDLGKLSDTLGNVIAEALRGAFGGINWEKTGKATVQNTAAPVGFWTGFFQGLFEGVDFKSIFDGFMKSIPVGSAIDIILKAFGITPEQASKAMDQLKPVIKQKLFELAIEFLNGGKDVKGNTELTWQDVKNAIYKKLYEIYQDVVNKWEEIKKTVKDKLYEMYQNAVNKVQEWKDKLNQKWDGMKQDAWNKFQEIKKKILDPIKNAKDEVLKIVDKITSAFNKMKLTVPKPKLPKISIEWKTYGKGPVSISVPIPHVAFATGGIVTGPVNALIGEAGDEAVVPLSNKSKMKPFAQAVAKMMDTEKQGQTVINNYFTIQQAVIREEADIEKLAERLNKKQKMINRAGGIQFGY